MRLLGFPIVLMMASAASPADLPNGSFEWARECPWEGNFDSDQGATAPAIKRDGASCSGDCSYVELVTDDDTQISRVEQDFDLTVNEDSWIVVEFCAYVAGGDDGGPYPTVRLSSVVGSSSQVEVLLYDTGGNDFRIGYQIPGPGADTRFKITFNACGEPGLTMRIDQVRARADTHDPVFCWENGRCDSEVPVCSFGAHETILGLSNENDPCCPGDVNLDGTVDVADILAILQEWEDENVVCVAEDATGDGYVTVADILVVLSGWGPCDPEAPSIDPFDEVVEDMGLEWPDDWDEFEYYMENGSASVTENYNCWMQHYIHTHYLGLCFCAPDCPDADPFGNSHYPY